MAQTRFTMTSERARDEALYELNTAEQARGLEAVTDETTNALDLIVHYPVHEADAMVRLIQIIDPDAVESRIHERPVLDGPSDRVS